MNDTRSRYDRFHAGEEVDFHPEAFAQGVETHGANFDMFSQNPYEHGSWMWKSFIAGWAYKEADPDAARAELETRGDR